MTQYKEDSLTPDSLDILSSIWILSCNDENPIITYEGLEYRLSPPSNVDVRKLVQSRGELFRRKVPPRRLAKWKQEMLAGKHLPSYLRDMEDEAARRRKIETITPDDVFRNQFRAESDAPRAQVEILDWGQQHIDILRKARIEAREENLKKWSSKWLPLLSIIFALVTVLSTAYFQKLNIDTQERLKYYEVELKPKEENYDLFMTSLIKAGDDTLKSDHAALVSDLTNMELAYFRLERFLEENSKGSSKEFWNKIQAFSTMCYKREEQKVSTEEYIDTLPDYKKDFSDFLNHTLYPDSYR